MILRIWLHDCIFFRITNNNHQGSLKIFCASACHPSVPKYERIACGESGCAAREGRHQVNFKNKLREKIAQPFK